MKIDKFPKVYIIILNYNGWQDTIECLESVLRNEYPNYQVIVVDNGSTDGSVEMIKKWADGGQEVLTPNETHPLYYLSHPPVRKPIPYIEYDRKTAEAGGLSEEEKLLYEELPNDMLHPMILIQTGDNLGFAGGNNTAYRYVSKIDDCKYVWFLNNDAVITPDSLRLMVEHMGKKEDFGVIGSIITYYDFPNRVWFNGGKINYYLGGGFHVGKGSLLTDQKTKEGDSKICDFVTGCSMLVRADIFENMHGFDERFFLNYEDIDLCYRILRKGWKIGLIKQLFVFHKVSVTQKKENIELLFYHVNRSRVIWIRKTVKTEKKLILGIVVFLLTRFAVIVRLFFVGKQSAVPSVVHGVIDGFRVKL